MKAIGIIGFQDSGKTTLVEAVARELASRGHKVAAVKHSSHEMDLQGKDTARLRRSLAQVAFVSPAESVVIWNGAKTLEEMLAYLDADIALIEGFKRAGTFPKIVCLRGDSTDRELFDGLVVAAVGPGNEMQGIDVPLMDRSNVGAIADLVEEAAFKLPGLDCEACGYESCYAMAVDIVAGNRHVEDCVSLQPTSQVFINGVLLPMKPFVADVVQSTVVGLLSTLKGFSPGKIEIRIG